MSDGSEAQAKAAKKGFHWPWQATEADKETVLTMAGQVKMFVTRSGGFTFPQTVEGYTKAKISTAYYLCSSIGVWLLMQCHGISSEHLAAFADHLYSLDRCLAKW